MWLGRRCSSSPADGGDVLISPHRHLCSKGIRLMGVAGEEPGAYLPAMRQLARWRLVKPAIDRFVSDRFPLTEANTAMDRSMDLSSRKVVFVPSAGRVVCLDERARSGR